MCSDSTPSLVYKVKMWGHTRSYDGDTYWSDFPLISSDSPASIPATITGDHVAIIMLEVTDTPCHVVTIILTPFPRHVCKDSEGMRVRERTWSVASAFWLPLHHGHTEWY